MNARADTGPGAHAHAQPHGDVERREETAQLGIWVFLATEILFFGVLCFVYTLIRMHYSDAFAAASRHTDVVLGTINTAVLLTSSFTMALAVRSSTLGARQTASRFLVLTAALGGVFLAIKGIEYYHEYLERLVPGLLFEFAPTHAHGAQLFFTLYFAMTGVHALHLIIGIAIVLAVAYRTRAPARPVHERDVVEVTGLYWHLVDIVWIFLYPLLYLVSRT